MANPTTTRALLAALLLPAGCFYTSAINERPHAEIRVVDPGPHFPGTAVTLSAAGSFDSEDGNQLQCVWTAELCDDDGCATTDATALPCTSDFTVVLPRRQHRSVPVRVVVTDQTGADFAANQTIEVGNRRPEVEVQVRPAGTADHSVVGVPVQASVLVDDADGDDVTLSWALLKPRGGGAAVELGPVDGDGLTQEFTPDLAGLWMVQVTADDGIEEGVGSGAAAVEEDGPPCLALTSPTAGQEQRLVLRREDSPRAFAVLLVADDLDPFPGPAASSPYQGEPTFAWKIASPDTGGELVPVAGAVAADLTIDPAAYAPGDLIDLRVEVGDRVDRTLPCDDAAPSCALGGDVCRQRLSWGVEIR